MVSNTDRPDPFFQWYQCLLLLKCFNGSTVDICYHASLIANLVFLSSVISTNILLEMCRLQLTMRDLRLTCL